jgi:tellurite resistance protein TerC
VNVTAADWLVLLGTVLVLFAVDLLVATLRPHVVGFREAALWSAFFIAVAAGFGVVVADLEGWGYAGQFYAGYIVEKSLSVDNLFVFVIIMSSFAVPREHQQRVLIFGIAASLCLRAAFIAVGAALLSALSFMFLIFGLALLWTAGRLFTHRDADPDVSHSPLVRATRRFLPVTDSYDGGRLITGAGGRRVVTPLFIVFAAIGGTDMLFALDSIPAVFGVTSEAYIVFAANAFALLGLRALYFLVTGLLDRLVYLSAGLAVILAFIGAKLILHWAHGLSGAIPEISTALSLGVIGGVLAITTAASLIKSRRDPAARAHAGAVLGTGRVGPAAKTTPVRARSRAASRPHHLRSSAQDEEASGQGGASLSVFTSLQVDSFLSYAIAFVLPALDAILPVVPSETAIIALGVATAGSADPRIALLVACAAIGAFVGDNLCYLIGRRFGPWAERRFFASEKGAQRLSWADRSLRRFGMQVIIVCRFIPGGRTAITLTCGLIGYDRRRFVIATAVAAVLWALYAFFIGRLGGKAFEDKPWLGFLVAFGGTAAISLLIEAARRITSRRKANRTARDDREPTDNTQA